LRIFASDELINIEKFIPFFCPEVLVCTSLFHFSNF